jgi:hypothetical protein
MPTDNLDALLARWLSLRQQGQTITAAELCRDCPELQYSQAILWAELASFSSLCNS